MGGWSDKTKLILISTQIEVVVEVEVELGNTRIKNEGPRLDVFDTFTLIIIQLPLQMPTICIS